MIELYYTAFDFVSTHHEAFAIGLGLTIPAHLLFQLLKL